MRRQHLGAALIALVAGLAVVASPTRVGPQPIQASASGSHTHGDGTLCVLRAIPQDMYTKVPPPEAFLRGELPGGPGERAATITVNYTGFTAQAQAAFQYAVGIWQAQLTSTGPIVVNATFADLGAGILGSAGATSSHRDFTGATRANTWYADALGNKLFGGDINSSTAEITANFSSTFTWYYGTDGNTPAGQYDFVSVVLHELCHGLGFAGSGMVSGGVGHVRAWDGFGYNYPRIWDHFVENGSAQALLTAFAEGSAALAAQLTGNSLYWNGSNGVSGASGFKPRMYAPATWSQGSSYSHLNETTYPAGNANSLMTYAIGSAEAIHDPGPITRGMFTDMGWTTNSPNPPPTFTDDPLTVGATGVKKVHITELRDAIATLRTRYSLSAVTWTDSTITVGSTVVKAVHITEMRTALAAVYAAASRTAPTCTNSTLTAGTTVVKAVDISELRSAVLDIW